MRRKDFKVTMAAIAMVTAVTVTSIPTAAAEIPQDMMDISENTDVETGVIMNEEGEDLLEPESGIVDHTAPALKDLTISTTSVKAPGTIEVIADATDDISGVRSIDVNFYGDQTPTSDSYENSYHVTLSDTYYDENLHQTVKYADGKWHGVLELTPNTMPGKYMVTYITVYDEAGNNTYYSKWSADSGLPEYVKNISFQVLQSDIAPIKIKNVNLSATTVNAPGEITVTAELDRDSTNVDRVCIRFSQANNSAEISAELKREADGKFVGKIKFGQYEKAGNYEFSSLSIDEGESVFYDKDSSEIPDSIKSLAIKVTNDNVDSQAPEIKDIVLSSISVEAPGHLSFTINGTDDLSGVSYVTVRFYNKTTGENLYGYYSNSSYYSQNVGEITIDQYTSSGTYAISFISMTDKAGNDHYYYADTDYYTSGTPIPDQLKNLKFQVNNDGETADVITSTISNSFLSDVKAASEDAIINVDITSNKVIPKEIFDAIKGTNKMLRLNSDDIQWVIKGSDITGETRDVDLSGNVSLKYFDVYSDLAAMLGETKCVTIGFAENAVLPGKATVRFMPDAYLQNWIIGGTSNLYIYCYNEADGKLETVASGIALTKENNLEFDVTQGGEYILTCGPAKATSVVPDGPNTWEGKTGTEGFVYRLYNVALSRDAEEKGLQDWNNRLQTKKNTAAEVAQGFFFSEEFQNKNYSDAQFVEILYRTMFGRKSDDGGKQYWLDCLANGVSREYVYHGFAESQEFSNLCDSFGVERGQVTLGQYRDKNMQATGFIARLYTQMLGRSFDEEGIEYWCKAYITGQKSIEEIASVGFLHSQELANQNLSNEEFVTRMYETFLNREPEEAGLKDWVGRLERGEETRDSLVYGFTHSEEFGNLKAEYHLP